MVLRIPALGRAPPLAGSSWKEAPQRSSAIVEAFLLSDLEMRT